MKFKKILVLIIIAIISLSLISCDFIKDKVVIETDGKNSELKYLITEEGQVVLPLTNFNTLNPLITENSYYFYFSKLIFEGLFDFDENLMPYPSLASDYSISEDGKTMTIKLQESVLWHDGEELTSEDVAFTINTLKFANNDTTYKKMLANSINSIVPSDINKIIDIKIIDKYTMNIIFSNAFGNNMEMLTFPIIPMHIFNGSKTQNYKKALEVENYNPIGTGPYKFIKYDKFKSISLERNLNYRNGKPNIENIVGKVLDDEELILTAFETGQISFAKAKEVDWDKYKNNNRVRVVEFVSNNYEFLGFNFDKEIFSGENGLAIRKAIYYGINRQDIIKKVLLGHGTQIDVPINPISYLIGNSANTYGHNVDEAKDILKSQGFADIDGDGILEDENGIKLNFRLLTNSYNPLRVKVAEMIKSDLKEIGINITLDIESISKEKINEEVINSEKERINNRILTGNFDIILSSWQMSIIPNLSFLYQSNSNVENNFLRYKNEDMDNLLASINNSSNRNEKVSLYEKLQELIVADVPNISLYFNDNAILVDSSIMGDLNPTFYNPYRGIENCILTVIAE